MQDQIRQRVDIYLSIWNRCITASCPKTCFLNASCKGSKRWFNQFPSVPSSGPTLEGVGRCFGCERGVDLFRVCQWPEPEIHVSFRFLLVPLPSFWPFLLRLRNTKKTTTSLWIFSGKISVSKISTKAKPPTWLCLTDLWTFLLSCPAASWSLDAGRVRICHLKGSRFMEDSMTFQGESLEDLKIFQTGGIFLGGELVTDVRCYIRFFYLSLPFFGGFFEYYPQVFLLQFGWISEGWGLPPNL